MQQITARSNKTETDLLPALLLVAAYLTVTDIICTTAPGGDTWSCDLL